MVSCSMNKDEQRQLNLAVQRAMQNTSGLRTEQTGRLEQQKDDNRPKIIK